MKAKLAIAVVILAVAGVFAGWLALRSHQPKTSSVVPPGISQAVNYPVYYPDQAKLPQGYTLDIGSFRSPVKNGVNYSVDYGSGKKLVFTLQTEPSSDELNTFSSNYLPLKVGYQTGIGEAEIGVYHNETLVSLPVSNGPWIIITAPVDINQSQLKQLLGSLRKN